MCLIARRVREQDGVAARALRSTGSLVDGRTTGKVTSEYLDLADFLVIPGRAIEEFTSGIGVTGSGCELLLVSFDSAAEHRPVDPSPLDLGEVMGLRRGSAFLLLAVSSDGVLDEGLVTERGRLGAASWEPAALLVQLPGSGVRFVHREQHRRTAHLSRASACTLQQEETDSLPPMRRVDGEVAEVGGWLARRGTEAANETDHCPSRDRNRQPSVPSGQRIHESSALILEVGLEGRRRNTEGLRLEPESCGGLDLVTGRLVDQAYARSARHPVRLPRRLGRGCHRSAG